VAKQAIEIPAGAATISGDLSVPAGARAAVLFAHGSGSSRFSSRNRFVAEVLNSAGLATLLIDLLTADEEAIDVETAALRFDIELLAERLDGAVAWLGQRSPLVAAPIGVFGASTGAAAALVTAARTPERITAVVSRGGRPDLAGEALSRVLAPTLLIVGGNDRKVLEVNRQALATLAAVVKKLEIVPGAGHLFEDPGALERVAELAANWFTSYLEKK
jgi:putative phosphoribosyl transferase